MIIPVHQNGEREAVASQRVFFCHTGEWPVRPGEAVKGVWEADPDVTIDQALICPQRQNDRNDA